MASFQLTGIDHTPFSQLFSLPDVELSRIDALRVVADRKPGFPCRVSLRDADIGEELLLLPYEHQPAASPYRSSGPIFVSRHGRRAVLDAGVISDYVLTRIISARAYTATHQMIDATITPGPNVAHVIESMFSRPEISYIHLHNAARGCFSCVAHRTDSLEPVSGR